MFGYSGEGHGGVAISRNPISTKSGGVVESTGGVNPVAARQDRWTDLVKLLGLSAAIVVPLAVLIQYQGSSLRGEIRGLRGEFDELREAVCELEGTVASLESAVARLESAVGELEGTVVRLEASVARLKVSVSNLEIAVARIEARDLLRRRLAERFDASGEGAGYGGPVFAADLLLARALPEIDAALSGLDEYVVTALAADLWEHRANILARAAPIP